MSNPIRIGLVGLGRAGYSMHTFELASRQDKFKFVACCDVIPERVSAFEEKFGAKGYATIEELIADPAVELVDIADIGVVDGHANMFDLNRYLAVKDMGLEMQK